MTQLKITEEKNLKSLTMQVLCLCILEKNIYGYSIKENKKSLFKKLSAINNKVRAVLYSCL